MVFHDHGGHVLDPLLKAGFLHCFAAVRNEEHWIRIDAQEGCPVFEVVAPANYDLAGFYREEGYTVVETQQRDSGPVGPFVLSNCVGMVKTVLGIDAFLAVTPWQLYRRLTGKATRHAHLRLPGSSSLAPPKIPFISDFDPVDKFLRPIVSGEAFKVDEPKVEKAGDPPPLPPERNEPDPPKEPIAAADDTAGRKAQQRAADLKRRGRAATILTSSQGVTEEAPLGRPSAKLGG